MDDNTVAKHLKIGSLGEDIACKELIKKGYRIIERNIRRTYGEIDIIARARDGVLVFVEVKTMRRGVGGLLPEDNVSDSKMRKVKKTCEAYVNHNPEVVNQEKGWRVDVLSIELLDNEEDFTIRWYENV